MYNIDETGSNYFSPYREINNFSDTRTSRNYEELINEREDEHSDFAIYQPVFDKIKEKIFIISEGDDIEISETDTIIFENKYNLKESKNTIKNLKANVAIIYLKKTEHEILIQERRKMFETFSVNVSNTLQSNKNM